MSKEDNVLIDLIKSLKIDINRLEDSFKLDIGKLDTKIDNLKNNDLHHLELDVKHLQEDVTSLKSVKEYKEGFRFYYINLIVGVVVAFVSSVVSHVFWK